MITVDLLRDKNFGYKEEKSDLSFEFSFNIQRDLLYNQKKNIIRKIRKQNWRYIGKNNFDLIINPIIETFEVPLNYEKHIEEFAKDMGAICYKWKKKKNLLNTCVETTGI